MLEYVHAFLARLQYLNDTAAYDDPREVTRRFYVSLFFLFFSLAATCFIVLLWAFFEVYLWPREHQDITSRFATRRQRNASIRNRAQYRGVTQSTPTTLVIETAAPELTQISNQQVPPGGDTPL